MPFSRAGPARALHWRLVGQQGGAGVRALCAAAGASWVHDVGLGAAGRGSSAAGLTPAQLRKWLRGALVRAGPWCAG